MKLQTFTADSANAAVAEIRRVLGPDAVVVHVRRIGGEGISRLWQKPRIEVVACVPEVAPPPASPVGDSQAAQSLAELRRELAELKDLIPARKSVQAPEPPVPIVPAMEVSSSVATPQPCIGESGWLLEQALVDSGVTPANARRMMFEVLKGVDSSKPSSFQEEIRLAMPALARFWSERNPPDSNPSPPARHVFVGPPGSGKTNVICKWMTMEVLLQGRKARVWRLDGNIANSAEVLSVYAEVLGAPVERVWDTEPAGHSGRLFDLDFVDLPGVSGSDREGLVALASQIKQYGPAQVHLVLNLAYGFENLLVQLRAYSRLGAHDLILTHLDEELHWGKLWNVLLGTNCRIRFLSAGQNIPGDFFSPDAERILSRQVSGA